MESNTGKVRYPCDFTFPERAIMVTQQLQAPETATRLASGRNPKQMPLGPTLASHHLQPDEGWPSAAGTPGGAGRRRMSLQAAAVLRSLCGAGTWQPSSSLFTEDQQVTARFSYGD